ncbi:MATE family efflux transporter [Candidatus Peregrinibacteria bacterium]|nr:MATE family efflux transporter [bacterium]NCQ55803.1 MATE family efflux transporter [Candidatus Parcubacteria bacterium]NCS67870.1 MATE family efflux transporter [Candidatus Peregrinibacteria bacterium]
MESAEKNLTKGPIVPMLWSLAWPTMLSIFFYTLYSIVDTFWVSKLSTDAIAAVSISQVALFIMISLSMGMAVGSSVVMGMHIGAKQKEQAEKVMGQSFVLATIMAVFFTTLALVFRGPFLNASGAIGTIYDPALIYFTISAAGSILFFYLINIMFAFNSEGDTLTLTKLFALSTLVNVVLDPLLIFGYGFMPGFGIAGAAYATLISQLIFIIISLRVLSEANRKVRFSFKNICFMPASVKRILNIGVPAALTQVINPIGTALLISIVSQAFSEPGATAYSLIFRLEMFAYLPAVGFGLAAMAMIGQSIGAGDTSRSLEIFKKATLLGFLSATGLGLALILGGRWIIAAFTMDALVIKYSLQYLVIVAGTYGLLAVGMVVSSVFQAIGKSWPGFWLFFVKFMVISVPLSYWVTQVLDLPIIAVWMVIAFSNILMAIVGYIWLRIQLVKATPVEHN